MSREPRSLRIGMSKRGELCGRMYDSSVFKATAAAGERSRALLDHHGVRWIGLAPAGHWVHLDQPDCFAAEVAGSLRGLPP